MEVPMSSKYIWLQPNPSSALLHASGDISTNVGIFVAAILAHPEVSLPGQYALVKTETTTFGEVLKVWSKVTGKEAQFVETTFEVFARLWGPYGEEMGMQFRFGAEYGNWETSQPDQMVSMEKLGIQRSELKGLEDTFEMVKSALV